MNYKSAEGERLVTDQYRKVLDRWPVPKEERRVMTREGETFVVVAGPEGAPPVLLLHGSATNSAMWSQAVAELAESFRVHAVDVIGEAGFSAPSRPALDSEAHALWLDDVLAELGIDKVALVGVSLGGWLSMDYATRRPDRVERVVLLGPSGIGKPKLGFIPIAIVLSLFGDWGRRQTLRIAAAPVQPSELMLLINKHFRPRMVRIPIFGDDALRALPMPVLVLAGANDKLLDSQDTARRVALIPQGTVRVLTDSGHVVIGQSATIMDFLRKTLT